MIRKSKLKGLRNLHAFTGRIDNPSRKPEPMPEPGKLLNAGEPIEKNDEYQDENGEWQPISVFIPGEKYGIQSHRPLRRPEPQDKQTDE